MSSTRLLTPEGFRTAAYLEARARLDAPRSFTRTGKTKGRIKCVPPNKPCGDRCIPPNWNCRITGGGLDSHSKVVEFDPVAGTGNIIRGTKNVIEGYRKKDPERITRGIKGIERGIVKITPGNSAEQKQRVRKRVQTIGTIAFLGVTSALALHATHRGLKRGFQGYRTGLGAEIDRAAAQGVERVLETWDAGVDRIGLGRLFGTGTAQIRGAGQVAASRLGRQGAFTNTVEARLGVPARTSNYLQTRARLRGTTSGIASINAIDAEAVRNRWSRDEWEARKIQALYGLRENNRSVFAGPATHEMLAAQWGFQLPPRSVRESGRFSETSMVRYRLLPEAVRGLHEDLTADLRRRRFSLTPEGISEYTNVLLRDNPTLVPRVGSSTQQRALEQEFRLRMREVIQATTSVQQRAVANNAYTRTLNFYDEYFSRAAEALTVSDNGRLRLSRTADGSPFGDAMVGLSRLHAGQSTSANARTRDNALFLNGYYFHSRVRRSNTPYAIRDSRRAIQYASGLSGHSFGTLDEALNWFRNNNYNVRVPSPRGRRDADDSERGQPCGASHIPKSHKCHKGQGKGAASASPVLANKHDNAYRARKLASIVLRVGAIGGGAAMAYYFGREAVKESQKGLLNANLEAVRGNAGLALTSAFVASAAYQSLHREKITTYDSDQLVDRYEEHKKQKDVDPHVVEQLQTFIKAADIDSQRVSTKLIIGGLGGYYDTAQPNRVHITAEGATLVHEAARGTQAYSKGVEKYMRYRAKASEATLDADKVKSMQTYIKNFSGSSWIGSDKGKVDYFLAHEIAHAIHHRSNFATPSSVVVNGKRYSGDALQNELRRSTSYYGQSDLFKRSDSTKDYYQQGNRLETYAENFALYVGNARAMKEYFPVSYEWTRQTTEYALKRPPRIKPKPFAKVVEELSKGARQFEPAGRRDANDADALTLLRSMQTAAVSGNVPEALRIYAEAQTLPQEQRFMFGSFLETAFMYADINSNGAS